MQPEKLTSLLLENEIIQGDKYTLIPYGTAEIDEPSLNEGIEVFEFDVPQYKTLDELILLHKTEFVIERIVNPDETVDGRVFVILRDFAETELGVFRIEMPIETFIACVKAEFLITGADATSQRATMEKISSPLETN